MVGMHVGQKDGVDVGRVVAGRLDVAEQPAHGRSGEMRRPRIDEDQPGSVMDEEGVDRRVESPAGRQHLLDETRPDIRVVFTDIDMPGGLDGMQLAAAIRDRWPPIELIIISGRRMPRSDEIPARGLFFSKPYKWEEVTAAIRRMAT